MRRQAFKGFIDASKFALHTDPIKGPSPASNVTHPWQSARKVQKKLLNRANRSIPTPLRTSVTTWKSAGRIARNINTKQKGLNSFLVQEMIGWSSLWFPDEGLPAVQ